MFIGQLLKIIFFAAIIYMIFNLVRYLIRIGAALRVKRSEEEKKASQNIREDGPRMWKKKKEIIELDKDQYKVE